MNSILFLDESDQNLIKQICSSPFEIFAGSNYIKHRSFVVVEKNKCVFKIYNKIDQFHESLYKFNWAKKHVTNFEIPSIQHSFIFENKGVIKFNYIEKEKNNNVYELLDSFYKLYDDLKSLDCTGLPKFIEKYELKEDYEKIVNPVNFILTHGDLNHKNIFRTTGNKIAVIDWDNLSFQPEELVENITSLYFLSHPSFHNENFKNTLTNILSKFKKARLNKIVELSEEKYKLSVTTISKNYWKYMSKKLT